MGELLSFAEIKEKGLSGHYIAVMDDGTERKATYVADFGGVLFFDRNRDCVVGFRFVRGLEDGGSLKK